MSSSNAQSGRNPEKFRVPRIVFLGEQDGPPERELKSRLAELFADEQSVSRAYLARISYGGPSAQSVALCLSAKVAPEEGVVQKAGKIFTSIFQGHQHLDIMFLSDFQEGELVKCCKPFFSMESVAN